MNAIRLCISIGVLQCAFAFANQDIKGPTLDIRSIQLSNSSLKAGQILTIRAKVTDNLSGVRGPGTVRVFDPLRKEIVGRGTPDMSVPDFYTFEVPISQYAVSGTYIVEYFSDFYDNAQNRLVNGDVKSFGITFKVENEDEADGEGPLLSTSSIQLSGSKVKAGERILIRARVTDDLSGVASAGNVRIIDPTRRELVARGTADPDNKDLYIFTLQLGQFAAPGVYKVDYFSDFTDNAGNRMQNGNISRLNITFEVENSGIADTVGPLLDQESITLSAQQVHVGAELTIRVRVTDDVSGVANAGTVRILDPTGKQVVGRGRADPSEKDTYLFSVQLSQYAALGTYTIDYFSDIFDDAGNWIQFHNLSGLNLTFEVK